MINSFACCCLHFAHCDVIQTVRVVESELITRQKRFGLCGCLSLEALNRLSSGTLVDCQTHSLPPVLGLFVLTSQHLLCMLRHIAFAALRKVSTACRLPCIHGTGIHSRRRIQKFSLAEDSGKEAGCSCSGFDTSRSCIRQCIACTAPCCNACLRDRHHLCMDLCKISFKIGTLPLRGASSVGMCKLHISHDQHIVITQ